jgi:hypothetical protein
MKQSEICTNCKVCGPSLTPIAEGSAKLIQGDTSARTLVIMNYREDWESILKKLMGKVPYAVTFTMRCSPSSDVQAQRINCSIFTRQLIWAFDAFVVEGDCGDDLFVGANRESGISSSSLGPVVFINSPTGLRASDYGRFCSAITTMQELKSGRVLRKAVVQ